MRGLVLISIVAVGTFTAGCERQEPVETIAPPAVMPPTTAPAGDPVATATTPTTGKPARPPWRPSDDPKKATFLGLVADKPATWIEHPPQGSMRLANFTVPGRDGAEAAHIVVFYFGATQGGSIDANIDRWQMQFEPDADNDLVEPSIDSFEADTMAVTLVEFAGSWKKMGATWYTPDQLFMTAIVETPRGNLFIRFAGQTATVEANRPDFVRMIRGLRKADVASPDHP